jgi:hypothetical protein
MSTEHSARPTLAELVAESRELHSAGRNVQDEICESLECRYQLLSKFAKLAAKPRPAIELGVTR